MCTLLDTGVIGTFLSSQESVKNNLFHKNSNPQDHHFQRHEVTILFIVKFLFGGSRKGDLDLSSIPLEILYFVGYQMI